MTSPSAVTLRASRELVIAVTVGAGVVGTILVGALIDRRGSGTSMVLVAGVAAFAIMSVLLAAIDFSVRRLPNILVLPSIAVFLVLLCVDGAMRADVSLIVRGLLGAAIPFLIFAVIAMIDRRAIGGGDVKFVALTGGMTAWVSLEASIWALVVAFLTAGLVAVVALVTRRYRASSTLPFGPFLAFGAWVGIVLGA